MSRYDNINELLEKHNYAPLVDYMPMDTVIINTLNACVDEVKQMKQELKEMKANDSEEE